MRNRVVAGLLAFIGGSLGIHRFYLGQIGLGILYIFFFWITWLVGIIDAIVLLSMDEDRFNEKYNKDFRPLWDRGYQDQGRDYRRERRRDYRQERRENRRRPAPTRRSNRSAPAKAPKRPKANPFRKSGIQKFKDYDYEGAIKDFTKALEVDPKDIATHFNLACAHSLMENKDKSFYHLDRAVALGFNDWDMIKNRGHLAYLRVQPEFLQFEANGFRLAEQLAPPKENDLLSSTPTQNTVPAPDNNLLDQLQRLAELKEKGLLTDEEFRVQKEKLLR